MTINGKPYSAPRNINLKGSALGSGLIRWSPQGVTTWSTSPFSSDDYGLYINSSNQLVFSSLGSTTVIGAAGSGGASSWDAIYAGDQTLAISGTTLTFDGTHASNNVITISNTGAGSGHLLQITNTGTGKDIRGTSGTWDVSALGAMTGLSLTLAGTAATTSFTMTLGNMVISAGGIAVTKATNTSTFDVTNNSVTTNVASTFTLNGLTSGGGILITSSGTIATTGYLLTLTGNSATTAAGLLRLNANGLTSGIGVVIASSATAITGAGRLLRVDHTGTTSTSGILSEFASAAADGTVILKVTASGILLTGGAGIWVSASAMTTGKGINMPDLDALTTGIGLNIVSAATAITGAGRLFLSSHTGLTGTSAVLNEFISLANDETIVLQVKAAALTSGTLLVASGALIDTGKGIDMSNLNALTSGVGLHVASTSTTTTSGSLLRISTGTTGLVATNGIVSITATADYTSASNIGLVSIAANSVTAGTIANLSGTALTTGVGLRLASTGTGITSGSLLVVTTGTTGAVATNGVVSIRATGAYTSTSNVGLVDVLASATTAGTVLRVAASAAGQTATELLRVEASGYTTGYSGVVANFVGVATTGAAVNTHSVVQITGANTTGGNMLQLTNNALTTGLGVYFAHTTSVIADGGSMMRLTSSSVDTGGATNGFLLDVSSSGTTAGTLVKIVSSAAAQLTSTLLDVIASGYTTGYTGSVMKVTGVSTTGASNVLLLTGANTSAGTILRLTNDALTTGVGMIFAHATSVIADGGSLLRLSSSSVDTGGATNATLLDLASTGSTAGIFVALKDTALATGTAAKIYSTSVAYTSANLLKIDLTSSGTLAARTGAGVSITNSMTHTANTSVTENFNDITVSRTVIRNTGGADANTTTSQGTILAISNTITATTGTITDTVKGLSVTMSSSGTGDGINITHAATGGIALNISGAATTVDDVLVAGTGAKANGKGSLRVTNSGATAAGGGVLVVSATGTPGSATSYLAVFDNSGITATNNPPAVFINQIGTGAAIKTTTAVQSTNFRKIMTDSGSGVTLWFGNGTTGQANLSGTVGDILFNGGVNKPEYCTGTTNWVALV